MMEAKKLGHNVYVLTSEKCLKEAWPRGEYIDDIWAVPNLWDEKTVRNLFTAYVERLLEALEKGGKKTPSRKGAKRVYR